MRIQWKRIFNDKKFSFECNFVIGGKINGNYLNLPESYLEKDYLQEALQSVIEEYILDTIKHKEQVVKMSEELDPRTRVRNHFRNITARKKFLTIREHVKYLANYYDTNEMEILKHIEDDIEIIKQTTGLK